MKSVAKSVRTETSLPHIIELYTLESIRLAPSMSGPVTSAISSFAVPQREASQQAYANTRRHTRVV